MAKASHKHFGAGAHGKGSGTGAMTDLPAGLVPDNMVLSNRDKAAHTDDRGLDSRAVYNEQHPEDQEPLDEHPAERPLP